MDENDKEVKYKTKKKLASSGPTKRSKVAKVTVRPMFFCSRSTRNITRASLSKMKSVQQRQLAVFRKKSEKGCWDEIHHDHFDWYMFPIEDGSQRQYNVCEEDVEELKGDEEWREGYLEAVELVAKAWGWDVKKGEEVDPLEDGMGWTNWDVRLAKIIRSFWIFREKAYMESMQKFARIVAPNGGLCYGCICLDEVLYMTL